MSGYLIDTNVISEYNREGAPHPGVVRWMEATPEGSQYLSVLTLAEIEKGILLLDEGKRRQEINQWFENESAGEVRRTHSVHRQAGCLGLGAIHRAAAQTRQAFAHDRFAARRDCSCP